MHPATHAPDSPMATDDAAHLHEPDGEAIQQTQSTQPLSQPIPPSVDGHLWGFLQPCSAALTRIDFWKISPSYSVGRNSQSNDVVLPGYKISNKHCRITWDGKDDHSSAVTVYDTSSNGTFINGKKIGKGCTKILREGNEIAFGTSIPQPRDGGIEDYRFVYRHIASGVPDDGLYAHYDLSTELGKGSFATVMKAVSRSTGLWYAIKMINKDRIAKSNDNPNASRAAQLGREISILEKLRHPNICQLKEVFYTQGNIYLVLELVEGGDLLDYIIKRNGLSETITRHITYQICDALSYIHGMGVAHRDLKPENVLLTKDVPPVVKVADFGLAKVVDSLTMLRTMCGTPSYLAPEIVMQTNREGYHHVVDSWSVGVIIFSMLTNTSPFIEDDTQRDLRTRIAERTVDWSSLTHIGVSQNCEAFIRELLEVRPEIRMSLTSALQHPWLKEYIPVYPNLRCPPQIVPSGDSLAAESSMPADMEQSYGGPNTSEDAGVSQGLQLLTIRPSASHDSAADIVSNIPGAFPNGNTTPRNGITREESRTAPLQRRSQVLLLAAEGEEGPLVPEPSWEMIENMKAGRNGDKPEEANTPKEVQAGHKRLRSHLTPLPEEYDHVHASPSGNASAARKKGRTAEADHPAGGAGENGKKKGRGKVNGKAGAGATTVTPRNRATGGQREDAIEEDNEGPSTPISPTRPRRSSRSVAQKAARRFT